MLKKVLRDMLLSQTEYTVSYETQNFGKVDVLLRTIDSESEAYKYFSSKVKQEIVEIIIFNIDMKKAIETSNSIYDIITDINRFTNSEILELTCTESTNPSIEQVTENNVKIYVTQYTFEHNS